MTTCIECHQEFTVSPQDRAILDKLELPTPALCGTHALQRRLAYRNERYLYRRECELCGVSMLAQFSKESSMHVYCRECWYGDQWAAESFGRSYDPDRSFFEQWHELLKTVPQYNLFWGGQNKNCDFANNTYNSKDVYLASSTLESEGVLYSKNTDYSQDIVDCLNVTKNELSYECVDTQGSYHSAWLTRCDHCSDCYLSRDLVDCQDCFGSVNLKHKRFYWFNEPLPEQEYKQRLAKALKDRQTWQIQVDRFTLHQLQYPVQYALVKNSTDSIGNDVVNSHQVRVGFNAREDENVGQVFRLHQSKDCVRESYGKNVELCAENLAGVNRRESIAIFSCMDIFQVNYSMNCESAESLFGCIGLRGKKFYILNKQYTEPEYIRLRTQIVQDMRARGEWGEYFPTKFSPQAYNDTVAFEYWPLSRDAVIERAWRWQEERGGTKGKESLNSERISSDIGEIEDTLLKEILACVNCGFNYKIQTKELQVLRDFHLAVPLDCPECRFQKRLSRTYVPELFERTCMCTQPHPTHQGNCSATFQSIYKSSRPEIVYCQECYAAETV